MKVRVAKSAGFCVGVRRAVEMVLKIADENRKRKIFTFNPLINNPQTVAMLEDKGIGVVGEGCFDRANAGDIVVVSAHGISPKTRNSLENHGFTLCDATCPKVAYVHKLAQNFSKNNFAVIIIGDAGHPEVLGIEGEISTERAVIKTVDELNMLPNWQKVAIIAQTTMDRATFELIVAAARQKFQVVEVKNTLCSETAYRQDEIVELSQDTDIFVVVGGRKSANTIRLAELAEKTHRKTLHIETAQELNPADFVGIECVSVLAGASTPHWIIAAVVEKLETLNHKLLLPWKWRPIKNLAFFALRSNFVAAFAAAMFTAYLTTGSACGHMLLRASAVAAALFGTLNMYEHREWQSVALVDPNKVEFVRKNRKFILPCSVFAALISITLSFLIGYPEFFATTAAVGTVALYFATGFLEKTVPAWLKDGYMTFIWTFLLWAVGAQFTLEMLVPIMCLGSVRALIFGLKELETDKVLQRKSFSAAIGERMTIFLGALPVVAGTSALLLAFPFAKAVGFICAFLLLYAVLIAVGTRMWRKGNHIETITDVFIILASLFIF